MLDCRVRAFCHRTLFDSSSVRKALLCRAGLNLTKGGHGLELVNKKESEKRVVAVTARCDKHVIMSHIHKLIEFRNGKTMPRTMVANLRKPNLFNYQTDECTLHAGCTWNSLKVTSNSNSLTRGDYR